MALRSVAGLLWRRLLAANFDSLGGVSRGQYDIRLGRDPDVEKFFEGLPQRSPTSLGGYELLVPIEAFDGPNPVPATELRIRFMGPRSERKDWNIPSQRPETAYPLWRLTRATRNRRAENYVVLVRDSNGHFHARWLDSSGLAALPQRVRNLVKSEDFGVTLMEQAEMSETASTLAKKLRSSHNLLLYGPPGTGKSQLMWEVAKAFGSDPLTVDTADEQTPLKGGQDTAKPLIRWLTFHQSYGYEDFVIGLRPDLTSTKPFNLKPHPGVLLELAEHCRTTGGSAVLLVDEINRGNVSRIFGEFITLLEPDKRLAADGKVTRTTVEVTLPYVDEHTKVMLAGGEAAIQNPFTLPANIYLLASMNSVDRSVAPLDAALRRRFSIINLDPDLDELKGEFSKNPPTGTDPEKAEVNELREIAISLVSYLNDGIAHFRGPDYQIGQWYLAPLIAAGELATARTALNEIWSERLLPHLEDVFHGRAEQLEALLGNDGPIEFVEPNGELEAAGARTFARRRDFSLNDTLQFGRSISQRGVRNASSAAATETGIEVAPDAAIEAEAEQ